MIDGSPRWPATWVPTAEPRRWRARSATCADPAGNQRTPPRRPMTMHARTFRSVTVLALALSGGTALVLAGSDLAGASCMPPADVPTAISQSDIVVVGTVTSARSQDRVATVRVEERWKGDVGPTFEVFGGPAVDGMATSVDRTYEVGGRYLLFAREPAAHGDPATFGGRYEDSGCSTTQAWTDALAQFRPATATIIGDNADGVPPASTPRVLTASHATDARWWLLAVIVGSALVVTASVISRRRSATEPPARTNR